MYYYLYSHSNTRVHQITHESPRCRAPSPTAKAMQNALNLTKLQIKHLPEVLDWNDNLSRTPCVVSCCRAHGCSWFHVAWFMGSWVPLIKMYVRSLVNMDVI